MDYKSFLITFLLSTVVVLQSVVGKDLPYSLFDHQRHNVDEARFNKAILGKLNSLKGAINTTTIVASASSIVAISSVLPSLSGEPLQQIGISTGIISPPPPFTSSTSPTAPPNALGREDADSHVDNENEIEEEDNNLLDHGSDFNGAEAEIMEADELASSSVEEGRAVNASPNQVRRRKNQRLRMQKKRRHQHKRRRLQKQRKCITRNCAHKRPHTKRGDMS